jgi:hypothetical protein
MHKSDLATIRIIFQCKGKEFEGDQPTAGVVQDEARNTWIAESFWLLLNDVLAADDKLAFLLALLEAFPDVPELDPEPKAEYEEIQFFLQCRAGKPDASKLQIVLDKYRTNEKMRLHRPLTLYDTGLKFLKLVDSYLDQCAQECTFRSSVKEITQLSDSLAPPTTHDCKVGMSIVLPQESHIQSMMSKLLLLKQDASPEFKENNKDFITACKVKVAKFRAVYMDAISELFLETIHGPLQDFNTVLGSFIAGGVLPLSHKDQPSCEGDMAAKIKSIEEALTNMPNAMVKMEDTAIFKYFDLDDEADKVQLTSFQEIAAQRASVTEALASPSLEVLVKGFDIASPAVKKLIHCKRLTKDDPSMEKFHELRITCLQKLVRYEFESLLVPFAKFCHVFHSYGSTGKLDASLLGRPLEDWDCAVDTLHDDLTLYTDKVDLIAQEFVEFLDMEGNVGYEVVAAEGQPKTKHELPSLFGLHVPMFSVLVNAFKSVLPDDSFAEVVEEKLPSINAQMDAFGKVSAKLCSCPRDKEYLATEHFATLKGYVDQVWSFLSNLRVGIATNTINTFIQELTEVIAKHHEFQTEAKLNWGRLIELAQEGALQKHRLEISNVVCGDTAMAYYGLLKELRNRIDVLAAEEVMTTVSMTPQTTKDLVNDTKTKVVDIRKVAMENRCILAGLQALTRPHVVGGESRHEMVFRVWSALGNK